VFLIRVKGHDTPHRSIVDNSIRYFDFRWTVTAWGVGVTAPLSPVKPDGLRSATLLPVP
jgi:hypothetical protein